MNDYRSWDHQITVGARIAGTNKMNTVYGTVVELGKPLSKYSDRPGFVRVQWDGETTAPTKFNSHGDAWGSSGKFISRFGWRLANAEQAANDEVRQRKEQARRDRMRWLNHKMGNLLQSRQDVETVAAEMRLLADLLEGDFVGDKPAAETENCR